MTGEKPGVGPAGREYVERLLEELTDQVHKRLIEAYAGDDPVASMEAELTAILEEVMENEA